MKKIKKNDSSNYIKNIGAAWYAIQVYTGKEEQVMEDIENLKDDASVGDYIKDVFVATEKTAIKKTSSETKFKEKNSFSGYIFVKMELNQESWYRVRNTENVISIPSRTPLSVEEIRRLGIEKINIALDINVGDRIIFIKGPFENMKGEVVLVNNEKQIIDAKVSMFGRETILNSLSFDDIQKD